MDPSFLPDPKLTFQTNGKKATFLAVDHHQRKRKERVFYGES